MKFKNLRIGQRFMHDNFLFIKLFSSIMLVSTKATYESLSCDTEVILVKN